MGNIVKSFQVGGTPYTLFDRQNLNRFANRMGFNNTSSIGRNRPWWKNTKITRQEPVTFKNEIPGLSHNETIQMQNELNGELADAGKNATMPFLKVDGLPGPKTKAALEASWNLSPNGRTGLGNTY